MKRKRNPDTTLASLALHRLGEYIATRRDLDNADPKEIEAALKKAGKVPAQGDHYYTAFHAGLKALAIRKRTEGKLSGGWLYLETLGAGTDEVRGRYRHLPCGTELEILQGYGARACPKCNPEEWAAERAKEAAAYANHRR